MLLKGVKWNSPMYMVALAAVMDAVVSKGKKNCALRVSLSNLMEIKFRASARMACWKYAVY